MNFIIENGDALEVIPDTKTMIAHVVNDRGLWGAGFVVAISKKWEQPEQYYRSYCSRMFSSKQQIEDGTVQFVSVEPNVTICNMFAMNGVASMTNPKPLNLNSLFKCLKNLRLKCEQDKYELIQMPKIGAGLARGDWDTIEKLIKSAFFNSNLTIKIKVI
jgi:O-acetyl-ADP-ribose deacetylase (regulator of RNase III)